MITPFNPKFGSVIISARVSGPAGSAPVRMVVDTGASYTMIRPDLLRAVGYDPSVSTSIQPMTTVSGTGSAPSLLVDSLEALGLKRSLVTVVAHALPPQARIDGLLGLKFFRGLELNINFRKGEITLI